MSTESNESEFVGRGHHELVDWLIDRHGAICAGDVSVPRLVLIQGASGSGKSRVIREFYRRLATEQSTPHYWPALASSGSLAAVRKAVGPDLDAFVWEAGALPDFSWWALNCERLSTGASLELGTELGFQASHHLDALELAWKAKAGRRSRLAAQKSRVKERAKEVADEAGMTVAGIVLEAAGVVIPGAGLLRAWVTLGAKALMSQYDLSQRLSSDVEVGLNALDERRDDMAALARSVRSLTLPDLPAVVAVEDLHLMSRPLEVLLEELSQRPETSPVLIVATAWPEGRRSVEYNAWISSMITRGLAEVIEIPKMETESRASILIEAAPRTHPQLVAALAERYTSPYLLRLLVTSTRFARGIAANRSIDLGLDEIQSLPTDVLDFYQARWKELPEGVRSALRLTAKAVNIDKNNPVSIPFIAGIVDRAAMSISVRGLSEDIMSAVNPYQWFTTSGRLLNFEDPELARVAAQEWSNEFGEKDAATFGEAVCNELAEFVLAHRGEDGLLLHASETELASRWLLALPQVSLETVPVALASWLICESCAESGWFHTAVELSMTYKTIKTLHGHVPSRTSFMLDWKLGRWIYSDGRGRLGAKWIGSVADDVIEELGSSDVLALEMRLDAIIKTSEAETSGHQFFRPDYGAEVLRDLDDLLVLMSSKLGINHRLALRTRVHQLVWQPFANMTWGEPTNEIPAWRDLILLLTQHLGADDPETLHARREYAEVEKLSTQSRIRELQELEETYLRLDGYTSPSVLNIRTRRGYEMQWIEGKSEDAFQLLNSVSADLKQMLGADHPLTIGARHAQLNVFVNEARRSGQVSALRTAIVAGTDLLKDAEGCLGDEHQKTVSIRGIVQDTHEELVALEAELLQVRLSTISLGLLRLRSGEQETLEWALSESALADNVHALLRLTIAALSLYLRAIEDLLSTGSTLPAWAADAIDASGSRGVHPDELAGIFLGDRRSVADEILARGESAEHDSSLLEETQQAVAAIALLSHEDAANPGLTSDEQSVDGLEVAFFGLWRFYTFFSKEIELASGLNGEESAEEILQVAISDESDPDRRSSHTN